MNKTSQTLIGLVALLASSFAQAAINGAQGVACGANARCFSLVASSGSIVTGDGNSLPAWGYAEVGSAVTMQYPGPTLMVTEGETVTVTLTNQLPVAASIVFPGQNAVLAAGGTPGLLTNEITAAQTLAGQSVTYTFTASQPGTYLYHSGTRPELEVEMGLVGALIVRPAGQAKWSYDTKASSFDHEYLYLLTEMDRTAHEHVGQIEAALKLAAPGATFDSVIASMNANAPLPNGEPWLDPATFKATLWFLNGRNGPDTLLEAGVNWLPNQPYNATTRAHPGDRILMRIIGAGRDMHPFHHHGNNAWLIARDARPLFSQSGGTPIYPDFIGIPDLEARGETLPDQSVSNFTIQIVPGSTYDAIFTWTGKGLNWDPYGHKDPNGLQGAACTVPMQPGEDPSSHCKTFAFTNGDTLPVTLPEQQALAFGGFWSGSPYLDSSGALPPLQGGLNPNNGYTFMWHSHTERELTNDDIFPGGMMTMLVIEPASTTIPD